MLDAVAEFGPEGEPARQAVERAREIHVPAIFAAEISAGLRNLVARGSLEERVARVALGRLGSVHTIEYPFSPFATRVWTLRNNLTVYDAWYVALAESLQADLWTADRRLASAPGLMCNVELVG